MKKLAGVEVRALIGEETRVQKVNEIVESLLDLQAIHDAIGTVPAVPQVVQNDIALDRGHIAAILIEEQDHHAHIANHLIRVTVQELQIENFLTVENVLTRLETIQHLGEKVHDR